MHNNLLDDNSLELENRNLQYPTKGARFGAAFIDGIITYFITSALISLMGVNSIVSAAAMGLIFPLYKIILEGTQGATLGKKAMNIQVVKDDRYQTPLTIADANKRFLLWWPMYLLSFFTTILAVDPGPADWSIALIGILMIGAIILYMGSILSIFYNEQGKTWHDKVGGTICVQTEVL